MQKSFASSLHVQKCWNKELFLHFKVLFPAASVTIFRKSSNHDWDGKTTSEPRQWALETSYLGKKYNTALGVYHVYIINCAIYNTLMKDDEIISHLQRKRGKCEMNYPATALFYSNAGIRLSLPINYTPYAAKQLNTRSYRGRRSYRLTAGSYLARRRIETVYYFSNSILWIIKRTLNPFAIARRCLAGLVIERKLNLSKLSKVRPPLLYQEIFGKKLQQNRVKWRQEAVWEGSLAAGSN